MNEHLNKRHIHKIELLISDILRIGVIASLTIVILGTIVSFVHHPTYTTNPRDFVRLTRTDAVFPRTVGEVVHGLFEFQGQAIVTLGLLLLIATPVVRVGVSVLAFVYQRDRVFVLITIAVFSLLILSFLIGRVEG